MTQDKALQKVCKLWEDGNRQAKKGEDKEDEESAVTLKEAFAKWNLEVAVLCSKTSHKSLYRQVGSEEIKKVKTAVLK